MNAGTTDRLEKLEASTEEWPGAESLVDRGGKEAPWREEFPEEYRLATPTYMQTFSTGQFRKLAEASGFHVESCEYAAGSLSNYPPWIICARDDVEIPARFLNKEQVVLVATKRSQ